MANTTVMFPQVYVDAPGQATTVFKMGCRTKEAIAELNALFKEVVYGKTLDE